ncbi:MAG: hypothetical protein H7A48_14580 [Akkermansiaceae bacterium]|nr:hypothetical protein [Akkermansiaceae bacterium]
MSETPSLDAGRPRVFVSPSGIRMEINPNGSLRRIDCGGIMINLFPGTMLEGGPANIRLAVDGGDSVPLLGPSSPSAFGFEGGFTAVGNNGGVFYQVRLVLMDEAPAWRWEVKLENRSSSPVRAALTLVQDIGIADYGAIRLNEYFVSQYIDHTPLDHPEHGVLVASRQNQPMGGKHPWVLTGSLGRGVSFATDALQIIGRDGLPGTRLQHEHSMVAIRGEELLIAPGDSVASGFFGCFGPDKPGAIVPGDETAADPVFQPHSNIPAIVGETLKTPAACLFSDTLLLDGDDVPRQTLEVWFGNRWVDPETDEQGDVLSFFLPDGAAHVVTAAKERAVLRPHGHILRSGSLLVPDESALTSTCWMDGVFHSMVTQGHVSINRFLSTCHGYLRIFRSHGMRVFVRLDGGWRQLGRPSAFVMEPDRCRWIYQFDGRRIEVRSEAPAERHVLRVTVAVTEGDPMDLLFSLHSAMHGDDGIASEPLRWESIGEGVLVRPSSDGDVGKRFPDGAFHVAPVDARLEFSDDAALFADGISRNQPFLTAVARGTRRAGLEIEGRLVPSASPGNPAFWDEVAGGLSIRSDTDPTVSRLASIHPWFVHNALVHYLSPRGLEQYSGGGWGTRDVCQGAFEFLMAQGRFAPARDLLLRVFRQQNPDGDWPQWFMFFERERDIRPGDSHGDIVFWPLLATAQYLVATRDDSLLAETVPFFHPEDAAPVLQHIDRALDVILGRVVPGTSLAAYGHGDWNDALQPARPELRERLCSSWTVTLNHQTFTTLAAAFRAVGHEERATTLETMAANILDEFQRLLVVDDVVAGLVHFPENAAPEPWLHPRDETTGLSYSLLPMIHSVINGMFTPRQAEKHLGLIRSHLTGPDGARLFDRPLAYHGGIRTRFQRAETASYFGREIGLMYMHAHLRYGEALARFGDADGFYQALCLANPVGIRELVPSAAPRQANCYYSSSDAAFADRYEAFDEYDRVHRGEVALEGGWRVYSSGAGIAARLLVQCFLGFTIGKDHLVIDPVIPPSLDGLEATLRIGGKPVAVLYRIGPKGCGPVSVNLNGEDLDFVHEANPYRAAGVRISRETIDRVMTGSGDRFTIWLG